MPSRASSTRCTPSVSTKKKKVSPIINDYLIIVSAINKITRIYDRAYSWNGSSSQSGKHIKIHKKSPAQWPCKPLKNLQIASHIHAQNTRALDIKTES